MINMLSSPELSKMWKVFFFLQSWWNSPSSSSWARHLIGSGDSFGPGDLSASLMAFEVQSHWVEKLNFSKDSETKAYLAANTRAIKSHRCHFVNPALRLCPAVRSIGCEWPKHFLVITVRQAPTIISTNRLNSTRDSQAPKTNLF